MAIDERWGQAMPGRWHRFARQCQRNVEAVKNDSNSSLICKEIRAPVRCARTIAFTRVSRSATLGSWHREPNGADALGEEVDRSGKLGVPRLEHQMPRLKHWPEHREMEEVRLPGMRLVDLGHELRRADVEEVARRERDQPAHVEPQRFAVSGRAMAVVPVKELLEPEEAQETPA